MSATVLIATRNRFAEVRLAVESACRQSCRPDVLVLDDGSTDGTPDLLAESFPDVRIHRSETPQGYVVQRNAGVKLARTPIVISLDDDALFPSAETVAQTIRDFDDPRVGAVAIPYVEVGAKDRLRQHPPSHEGVFATSEFVGCAFAVRRDLFLRIGGFREEIFHQGEERDFCVRLLAAGSIVRVGRADPIHHHPSRSRDIRRMDIYGRRNPILYAWWNEPFPSALFLMAEVSAVGILSGLRAGRPVDAIRGLLLGYRSCWQERTRRRPVPRSVSRTFRRLWKHGPLPLAEIEAALQTRAGLRARAVGVSSSTNPTRLR